MNQQLFEKELEEITERIHQLELTENNEDNSWKTWFRRNNTQFIRKTALERKAIWNNLKVSIERKIKLVKEMQTEENTQVHSTLLIKFGLLSLSYLRRSKFSFGYVSMLLFL